MSSELSCGVGTAFAQSLGVDSADDLIGVALLVAIGGDDAAPVRFKEMCSDGNSVLWLVVINDSGTQVLIPWHALQAVALRVEGE
jgi:hypothetical protein